MAGYRIMDGAGEWCRCCCTNPKGSIITHTFFLWETTKKPRVFAEKISNAFGLAFLDIYIAPNFMFSNNKNMSRNFYQRSNGILFRPSVLEGPHQGFPGVREDKGSFPLVLSLRAFFLSDIAQSWLQKSYLDRIRVWDLHQEYWAGVSCTTTSRDNTSRSTNIRRILDSHLTREV